MRRKFKIALLLLIGVGLLGTIGLAIFYLSTHNVELLNPKGTIAEQQRQLMLIATILMGIIIVPVFGLTFGFAWRYREGNTKARYSPELAGNRAVEIIWWLIPFAIITILAVIAWTSSHKLDPYRPLDSSAKPVTIQVVALQWKWLFIYPDEGIATVNDIHIPTNTPINFHITADAPMNSFWIPQLGGQIYAMPGMSTQIHLQATQAGTYRGTSANISGDGFASMNFAVHADEPAAYANWLDSSRRMRSPELTETTYAELAKPSTSVLINSFSYPARDNRLYDTVVMKYMTPKASH